MPRRPSLRRRLETSPLLIGAVARLLAGWARFCHATTRWDVQGEAEVLDATARGPIVALIWHEAVVMGPVHWPKGAGRVTMLSDTSPIGRIAAAVQGRFGVIPTLMAARGGDLAATRDVLTHLRGGTSVALPGDGPMGPARILKDAPLHWARAAGVPVFTYAFAMSRQRRLRSWDRMILPLPFGRGCIVYRRISDPLPRRTDPAAAADMRDALAAAMAQAAADAAALLAEHRTADPR